jgi:hypothetical protein
MPVLEHVCFSTAGKGDECSKRPVWFVCVAEAVTTASSQRQGTVPRDAGCHIFEHASHRISITVTPGWKRNPNCGDASMATQIVMDHSGDSRYHFDAKDLKALA